MNKWCKCLVDCFCEDPNEKGFWTPKEHQECGCPVGCDCKVNGCVCRYRPKTTIMTVEERQAKREQTIAFFKKKGINLEGYNIE